jgi:hypothetical protein
MLRLHREPTKSDEIIWNLVLLAKVIFIKDKNINFILVSEEMRRVKTKNFNNYSIVILIQILVLGHKPQDIIGVIKFKVAGSHE